MDKILMKSLMKELWAEYDYASILAMSSRGKRYGVSAQGMTAAQDALFCSTGYVIKVYRDKKYAEYSFNELDPEDIQEIPMIINEIFEANKLLPKGLSFNEYDSPEEESMTLQVGLSIEKDPEDMGDEAILQKLSQIREAGLKANANILDCRANAAYAKYQKYFLSPNKELEQEGLWMTGVLGMMARKDQVMKNYFKSHSDPTGAGVLDLLLEEIQEVADATVELLDSQTMVPGEYECVCAPDVTGMIVHEAFGHGVEMDMFFKDRALAKEYIGEYVASPLVSMHDGAAAANEVASYAFDDEGTLAKDTLIIEKGILKRGISDLQTAKALKSEPTGNGRRENFERKAYTRMTNTFFEGGTDQVEDMIQSISYGFFLENATCGMEDPKNWGIQCMVNVAREIKDGQFTGKVFSPIVLSGYVPDLLKSISMMSEEVVLEGGGFCGKGYKEWVKVSDGGPYIKAKIRLG